MAKEQAERRVARRPMVYCGKRLDRGQVVELQRVPNDEKLDRLGYVAPLDKGTDLYRCNECGAEFVTEGFRKGHGDRRHREHPDLDPLDEDRQAEREDVLLDREAPLYREKSLAAAR